MGTMKTLLLATAAAALLFVGAACQSSAAPMHGTKPHVSGDGGRGLSPGARAQSSTGVR